MEHQSSPTDPFAALEELRNAPDDFSDIVMEPKFHMTPYGEQDDNGVDISLIRENLRLTPLQRILRGQQAAKQARELRAYGRRRIR